MVDSVLLPYSLLMTRLFFDFLKVIPSISSSKTILVDVLSVFTVITSFPSPLFI